MFWLKASWANRLFFRDVSGHPDVCETDAGMEPEEEHERQVDIEDDRPGRDAVELEVVLQGYRLHLERP